MRSRQGFTLLEILIVVAIIAIIGATIPLTANFRKQVEKSFDAKRKSDLKAFSNIMEDYQGDANAFAVGSQVCFDQITNDGSGHCSCHVCGKEPNKTSFTPYTPNLVCDPQYAARNYLYYYDCNTEQPRWYLMCAVLSELPQTGNYNYGVASTNADPETCLTLPFSLANPFPSATATPAPSATNTPIPTATRTPTPSPTQTLTPTPTNVPTSTPTTAPTNTPTPSPTRTPTPSPTRTPTPTPSRTPTPTPTTPICTDFAGCSEIFECIHGRCEYDDRTCRPDTPYHCY